MIKPILPLMLLLAAGLPGTAQDAATGEIIKKHLEASGAAALQKVNTIVMTGSIQQQDLMPVKIIRMRPDRYLMQFDVADITAFQGYDGQTAWWTLPWTGNAKPQRMPDDRLSDLKTKADFDGLLFDWKAKGHQIESTGRDTVGNVVAYRLKITKNDGKTEYVSIDPTRYLLLKRTYFRVIRGKEVAFDLYYRDYRPVEGIPFAFTVETQVGGQLYNTLLFDTIELNTPVEADRFHMPQK
ncbi:MAG TPA: hypothetical protein PKG48_00880 [Bacteroidales bacterium]|nr:hypothetical protein [Bacteroidales bacterium]HPS61685.1 hypothetical protein [Bacteroidales bacterium]